MTVKRFLVLPVALGIALAGWAYWTALADPVVREADVALPGWPEGEAPIRAVLISDLHVTGPDMPPSRLARIVGRINALRPDLVLIAGDLVSDKRTATRAYPLAEAVAPLAGLRARLGAVAVLGNHDHWRDAAEARAALSRAGVRVLDNHAARIGPLALGGLDDAFTGHDDLARTLDAMRALPGAPILLSHSPDPFPRLPRDVGLMLAGHTHCGQIRLPFVGAISTMSDHGERYACGLVRENGRTLIVTAGLGTSILPLRLGAVPDLWLIRLGP
jgi:predicted MPP superfamily phosphohydrolase